MYVICGTEVDLYERGEPILKGKIRYGHNLIMQIPYSMKDQLFFLYQTRALKLLDKEGLT